MRSLVRVLAVAIPVAAVVAVATPAQACDSDICRLCPPIDRLIDKVHPHLTECLA